MVDIAIQNPFKIGALTLSSNILYAPLAGCSDFPFRQMCTKFKPGLIFCEMVKMDALIRYDYNTFRLLDYSKEMHPIGAQLCGSKPEIAGQAARIIEDLGFDVIDLNCGCPVDKVTKDGSGSGLLKTPHLIGEILSNMAAAVSIPITVKIRAGWDENSIIIPEIVQIAEKSGAKAIIIHGRTRQQAYRGKANWDYIPQAKKAAKKILVIGNGDVFTPEDAEKRFKESKCDGLLISRGTLGKPWICEDIIRHLQGNAPLKRNVPFIKQTLLEHFYHVTNYQNSHNAIVNMRRISCWYLRDSKGTKKLKEAINRAKTLQEIETLIQRYDDAK